jgi:DNA-3-methyladenine glycosylase
MPKQTKIEAAKLPESYYREADTIHLAKKLIGKQLLTRIDGQLCGGIIAETEAYNGIHDKASHAYGGRKTERTSVMYRAGGIAYVYFSYGMHHLFNVVSSEAGDPKAVLIRGIIPNVGLETILNRRKQTKITPMLVNGPAKLCQALGITLEQNTLSLQSDTIWITHARNTTEAEIIAAKRVGVDYAGEDALLPWRFILRHPDYKAVKQV